MSKKDFTDGVWKIRSSDTALLIVDDVLAFAKTHGNVLAISCKSTNPDNERRWNAVSDCMWKPAGGAAGHLEGTVVDDGGESHPFAVTYAAGDPNWVFVQIVPFPGEPAEITVSSHGGGGASGNDDPV